jgi:hypothetical protein
MENVSIQYLRHLVRFASSLGSTSSICIGLAITVALGALLTAAPVSAQVKLSLNLVDSYIPSFPIKRRMNRAYRGELNKLQAKLLTRMEAGESMMCSAQILREASWMVNYTNRAKDIERRIRDLKNSLKNNDQEFAAKQDPKDGSFGPCFENWLWRFDASVDPLKALALRGEKPKYPLKIWEPVDTPEEIEKLFKDLLISDVASGHNKRKELNLAVTALGQLLWLDGTAAVFPAHLDRKPLAEALKKFVDEEWQDPTTGYWGAWYKVGDEMKKTTDLSNTFHIVSYRGGEVAHSRKIARTTIAIRHHAYPYGWYSDGQQNNHHNYDVARIINQTWDNLDEADRASARALLFLMTARSLALSISSDGVFNSAPFNTVGSAYYFGVSFFAEVGLFGNKIPRTRGIAITNTEGLRDRIEANLRKLNKSDPMVGAALLKLKGK